MKNKIINRAKIFLILFSLFLVLTSNLRADTLMLTVSGGYLFPADAGYREVYGRRVIVPEFKVGLRVLSNFYFYGNFFSFSKNGLTPELQEPARSKQQFFGGGLAYSPYLNKYFKAYLGAGVVAVTYSEEAMGITVSGNKVGFSVEGGLYLKEKFLLMGINAAYCAASSSYEEVNFKIGGGRASVLLGFIF